MHICPVEIAAVVTALSVARLAITFGASILRGLKEQILHLTRA